MSTEVDRVPTKTLALASLISLFVVVGIAGIIVALANGEYNTAAAGAAIVSMMMMLAWLLGLRALME